MEAAHIIFQLKASQEKLKIVLQQHSKTEASHKPLDNFVFVMETFLVILSTHKHITKRPPDERLSLRRWTCQKYSSVKNIIRLGTKDKQQQVFQWFSSFDADPLILFTFLLVRYSLFVADVRQGAVQRDPVADINVEAVFPVGLVDPVSFCQRERLPLFTVTCRTCFCFRFS